MFVYGWQLYLLCRPETLGNLNVWSRLHYNIVRRARYMERGWGVGGV
jgi:hypothetical protein